MSLLIPLTAALIFTCEKPTHHDGDAIRCAGQERAMRMHAIDAPEMPGACRPGRQCTPGDPYASRDYLRSLTRGRTVKCVEKDVDAYGRMVVRCTADGRDLGCAMVAAGKAVERYGKVDCDGPTITSSRAVSAAPKAVSPAVTPNDEVTRYIVHEAAPGSSIAGWVVGLLAAIMVLMNALGAVLINQDQTRAAKNAKDRLSNPILLAIGGAGGAIGMAVASLILDHKQDEPRFNRALILFAGLHLGLFAGLLLAR